MPDPRAFVFDAYGTLFDVHSVMEAARAVTPDPQALSQLWRQKQLEYTWLRSLMGRYEDFWLVTGQALRFALRRLGLAADEAQIDALMGAYLTLSPFPEVPGALRALARHARIAVVANADHDDLMRCLNHNGLRFGVVVDSETARCYKPDPRIFQRACDALPVPASEAVMVGDTPHTDVQGARRAGLRAVWLNRGHRDWPGNLARPDAVIDELGQLPGYLRRLDP